MYWRHNSTLPILDRYGIGNATAIAIGLSGLTVMLAVLIGLTVGRGEGEWQMIVGGAVGLLGVIAILQYPFIGLSLTIASALAIAQLPDIPGLSSISVLLGGATFGAYILKHRWDPKWVHPPLFQLNPVLFLTILFNLWVFLSHPAAAMGWESTRNWLFTFAQLFILAWLAGRVMTSPVQHKIFMVPFALIAVYSAFMVIQASSLGLDTGAGINSIRSGGLGNNANQSARYFTLAFLFLYYIRSSESKLVSLLALIGMGITGIGVFATLSRTGLVIFVIAFGMILLSEGLVTRRYKAILIILMFLGVFMLMLPNQFIEGIEERNEDTEEDARWGLWRGGLDMLADYPIGGVGIGRFVIENPNYVPRYLDNPKYFRIGAHNMYISILAETGLVGFTLFMSILGAAYWSYFRVIRTGAPEERSAAVIWVICLTVMMIGGLTKHDQYDKLLWTTIGMSLSFTYAFKPKTDYDDGLVVPENAPKAINADVDDELLGRYPLPKYD